MLPKSPSRAGKAPGRALGCSCPPWNLGAASPPPSPLPSSSFTDPIQRLFLGLLQLFPLKTPGISAERRENAAEAVHTHSCSSPGWISRQKGQESREKNNQEKPIFGIGFIFAPGGSPAFQEVLMEQEKKLEKGNLRKWELNPPLPEREPGIAGNCWDSRERFTGILSGCCRAGGSVCVS